MNGSGPRETLRGGEDAAARGGPAAEEGRRRDARRFGLALALVVLLLFLGAMGYVLFYGRFLRDPEQPPSVRESNPRVLTFELVFWGMIALSMAAAFAVRMRRRS